MWSPVCDVFDEKAKINKNLSAKYIVKERSALINDGNDLFYVYAHYPTTEPDVMVMPFVSKVNAELFCEALNAENECREADVVKYRIEPKRGEWLLKHIGHGHYFECSVCHAKPCIYVTKDTKFCPYCGATMDGEANGTCG